MFYAAIETDSGEILRVRLPDGQSGGKASLSFLVGLAGYCSNRRDPDLEWFEAVQRKTESHLCTVAQSLLRSFYSGDWDYQEDEYQFFLQRSPELQITEAQFRTTLRQVKDKWQPLPELMDSSLEVVRLLGIAGPEGSPWFEPELTIQDLEALAGTLALAHERGATRARIRFS